MFHSDGIIGTLEKLHIDFKNEKANINAAEVDAVSVHTRFMQAETDLVKSKNIEMGDNKEGKAAKQASIAESSGRRSTVSATLLDDQQYLKELSQLCADKATTYDQRTGERQDELSALTSAISIIKSTVAEKTTAKAMRLAQTGVSVGNVEALARNPKWMESVEAEAEEADAAEPLDFFQRKGFLAPAARRADGGRRVVAELLRTNGQKLRSALLTSLAGQVAADPLAKVKTLIQELIEKMLQEAGNDSNQEDWCNKATADAEQKRTYASEKVDKNNSDMALLESQRDTLSEEIATLTAEISSLELMQQEATTMREEENAENTRTVQDASAGLAAVIQATDILSKYYKTAAKATADSKLAMAQTGKGPADDAPDAGFKNEEAYTGRQGAATGIIGMLEVINGDFTRTIAETEAAEEEARKAHLEFMTESSKSLQTKNVASDEKTKQKSGVESDLQTADDNLQSQMVILTTAVKELMELKPVCIDTGMSYEERVARREDEIAAMNKGLCILEHYAEYGPDGLAGTAQGAC